MVASRYLPQGILGRKDVKGHVGREIDPPAFSILVVDDEKMIRELVIERLRFEGYNTE